jgi:phosphoribosyl 1,2-cyclic phosphodiesterase
VRATIWGCRGSLATAGASTVRVGGNTTSVELRTAGGRLIVLDAGTGIRPLGLSLLGEPPTSLDLILTHLHLDHVEGLAFFAPLFIPDCEITIWGPHQPGSSLEDQIRIWLSPPFFPRYFDELPSKIRFVERGDETWELDGLKITAATVKHPGTTLGYRFEEAGRAFAFIPDNELGLDPEAGVAIAAGADVLFHDAQYTDDEYSTRVGWGHSALSQLPGFLDATAPVQAVMFHHDPSHSDDQLEQMRDVAQDLAGRELALGAEGQTYEV